MIKFFRKIRQQLITENKFSKYLLYAIGEIVLVVIGILIALEINTWNNNKIERQLETNILSEILVNLDNDLTNLNSKMEINNTFIKNNRSVLEHLKNKTPLTDSLRHCYSSLYGRGNFQPITVAYENLKSQGIGIIQNDSLRRAISELYDFKYFYFTKDLQADFIPIQEATINQLFQKITSAQPYVSAEPVNLLELQNDVQFEEGLKQFVFFLTWINNNYKRGAKQIEEVQLKISKELDQRVH